MALAVRGREGVTGNGGCRHGRGKSPRDVRFNDVGRSEVRGTPPAALTSDAVRSGVKTRRWRTTSLAVRRKVGGVCPGTRDDFRWRRRELPVLEKRKMDPFAAHRQHMSALFGGLGSPLGFDPFLSLTDGRTALAPHPGALQHSRRAIQPGALSPFDMFGMGRVGFGDMFGMMNSMFSNMNSLLDNMVSPRSLPPSLPPHSRGPQGPAVRCPTESFLTEGCRERKVGPVGKEHRNASGVCTRCTRMF
ncbi:uncharacterized protein LOC134341807 [Mobula hypostoma]|uniref:uncharacterized protein LOC134341807 n=1 Tax=Mobula hypostoma TaxID=723540 RepID=UPI002FC388CF